MGWSRLQIAWAVLGVSVVGLLLAAVLAPPPRPPETGVEIALPSEPDRFATALRGSSEPPDDEIGDVEEAPLPKIVFGQPSTVDASEGGDVVITVSDQPREAAANRRPAAVPPMAPDDRLMVETSSGIRPGLGPSGKTPFTAYRRLQAVGDGPAVAVVLSGLGLDASLTAAATALPPEISLAFAPYGKDLPAQIEQARLAGHEVLIELPMGTPGIAPAVLGPAGLLTERTPAANATRLEWLLSRAPAYPMVTNYLGRGFSADDEAMARVMTMLDRAGLAYIDDTGIAERAARIAGLPYAAASMLIEPDTDDVEERLGALVARSAPGEVSLAKVYATPESVAALRRWATSLPDNTSLVPASTAVSTR